MAAASPVAVPYDDGSSTESEYYFDPREEAEEEAAYAWTHEPGTITTQDALNQPITQLDEDSTVIKQEYGDYGQLQHDVAEIALPQGSEWSHGAVSTAEYDNAVEQALAMARQLTEAQGDEPLTDDTMNSNAPVEIKEEKQEPKTKKTAEKVKHKMVSLKSVKEPTPPTSVAKSVVFGLELSLEKAVGSSSRLEKGLSVARSQCKSTGSQTSASQKASPSHSKSSHTPTQWTEHSKSTPTRKTESERMSSSRWTEHSKASARLPLKRLAEHTKPSPNHERHSSRSPSSWRTNHSKSPSSRRQEYAEHRKRSKSPTSHYSRTSRSRSPRLDGSWKRSRSRSPHRSSTAASPRSRSYRAGESVSSSQHHYDSAWRSYRSYKRSRSPDRSFRSYESTRERFRTQKRSRSRSRSLGHDCGCDRCYRHQNKNGRRFDQQTNDKTYLDPHHPSNRESISPSRRSQQNNRDTIQHESRPDCSPAIIRDHEKRVSFLRGDHKIKVTSGVRSRGIAVQLNSNRSASKPRLFVSESLRSRRPVSDDEVSSNTNANAATARKRSPRDPRVRPRVESRAVPIDTRVSKISRNAYRDAFERRVFKLKLQEADVDEKMAAGLLDGSEKWFYENRRRGIDAERARLMTQDLERYESVYASSTVTSSELKRYQNDRDFAWRVVQFKRKQASLQEQNDLFVSPETKVELWRRLDEDRDKLIAENPVMFHKVMMSQEQSEGTFKLRRRKGFENVKAPQRSHHPLHHGITYLKRPASGLASNAQSHGYASVNSRVVVGAALMDCTIRSNTVDSPRSRPGKNSWFQKY